MQKIMTCWLSQAVYIDVYREGYYNTQHLNLSCPHAKYRYQYPVPRSAENLHKRTQATAHSQTFGRENKKKKNYIVRFIHDGVLVASWGMAFI